MRHCANCKIELPQSEFDFLFSEEYLANQLCQGCKTTQEETEKKRAEEEISLHPDWYGPTDEL